MTQASTIGFRTRAACAAIALAMLVFAGGCETDDSIGGFTPSCLTFIENPPPADGEVTSVWGSESTCDQLELEIVASGLDDAWSASFEVVFPEELALFAAESFGDSFLRDDGVPLFVQTEVQQEDADMDGIEETFVVVGITRTDSDVNKGVDSAEFPDTSLIIRLIFFRFASGGSGPVTIRNAVVEKVVNVGDLPSPLAPPVPFSGGEFFIEN